MTAIFFRRDKNNRQLRVLLSMVLASGVVACGKEPPQVTDKTDVEVVRAKKPAVTKDQWIAAFRSSFEATKTKSGDDGITTYTACFEKGEGDQCHLLVKGQHDGFRKLDHLTPPGTGWRQSLGDRSGPYVGAYIAVPECGTPSVVLTPVVTGTSWLFMNKVAFMADDEVILERSFHEVERDHNAQRTFEHASFIANNLEIDALKKFASAKTAIIRISGQKGYVMGDAQSLRIDLGIAFGIVEKLNSALVAAGGPNCSS